MDKKPVMRELSGCIRYDKETGGSWRAKKFLKDKERDMIPPESVRSEHMI